MKFCICTLYSYLDLLYFQAEASNTQLRKLRHNIGPRRKAVFLSLTRWSGKLRNPKNININSKGKSCYNVDAWFCGENLHYSHIMVFRLTSSGHKLLLRDLRTKQLTEPKIKYAIGKIRFFISFNLDVGLLSYCIE